MPPETIEITSDANTRSASEISYSVSTILAEHTALVVRSVEMYYADPAESQAFTALSDASFAEDWDNPDDAVYNDL